MSWRGDWWSAPRPASDSPRPSAQTKAFVTVAVGPAAAAAQFPADTGQAPQRRAGIAGPLIRLPEIYRGVQGEAAYSLYQAAAAHAQAHLVFGGPRSRSEP